MRIRGLSDRDPQIIPLTPPLPPSPRFFRRSNRAPRKGKGGRMRGEGAANNYKTKSEDGEKKKKKKKKGRERRGQSAPRHGEGSNK